VIGPNPEVRQYLPSTKFLCRMLIGGDTSAWKKYSRAGRRKWYSRTYDFFSQIHQDNDYKLPGAQHPKISLGETPFSIEEGMSTQTNFQHFVYLIWINKKKYLLQPCVWNLIYTLTLEMMNGCYVKTLQEPSAYLCALYLFEFVGIFWDKSLN
jgi:hypothetical protein